MDQDELDEVLEAVTQREVERKKAENTKAASPVRQRVHVRSALVPETLCGRPITTKLLLTGIRGDITCLRCRSIAQSIIRYRATH